jgi:putative GTP pyrophosphokinase
MDVEQYGRFLTDYEQYCGTVLIPTNRDIRNLFLRWRDPQHWALTPRLSRLPSPSPVQRTHTRIKRPESVVDKILRHPALFSDGVSIQSVHKMDDAVAGRVVVHFLANLPLIDKALRNSEDLEVSSATPPVAYLTQDLVERLGLTDIKRGQKESGYESLHYVVRLRASAVPREERPWFELQVRTLVQDAWGEIEHILGYKPNKKTSLAVRRQFQIISTELTAIDEHFNLLYEELSRFQEESPYQDHSPLNAENLPPVLSELGIGCAQREIDGLLKLLVSRQIETVGDLRTEATRARMEAIRAVYGTCEGRVPNDFEIVASLAAIRGLKDTHDIEQAVKSQIDFLKAWEKLKQDARRQSS